MRPVAKTHSVDVAQEHVLPMGEGTLHGDLQRSTDSASEVARMPGSYAAGAIRRWRSGLGEHDMLGDFTARARDHIAPNRDMLHVDHREARGRCKSQCACRESSPGHKHGRLV